ncbi:MAG TPA: DUF4189 domain-containing protein [Gemmataceae bacterium]|nr:DUF4189 domain-containing protein [Gemmataceae bacterium]
MKALVAAALLLAATVAFCPMPVSAQNYRIDPNRCGAIAYSPKTGHYGYAWNQPGRFAAENIALKECGERDAKVLTWVRFGWAVLVIAEDKAYGFHEVHGDNASSKAAFDGALKHLRQSSNARVTTIITICSGDVRPTVTKV